MAALEQLTRMPLSRKIAAIAVVMLLLGAGGWFFYYQPVVEELDTLVKKQASLRKNLAEAERRKKTYDDDRRKRDELQLASTKQLQILPPDTEIASFLNNLNAQSDLVGLEILSVKPLVEQARNYYARIPVKLKLRGTYHQLTKFFYLVGNIDRIINIEDITLKGAEHDDSGVTMMAEVMATTFRSVRVSDAGGSGGKKQGKTAKGKAAKEEQP
ncbi:MAG TPA: type 4a pilus biogenesis protein PilO [Polyangia bacterium]|nr:type 4a pilus biogenesis protein PilO [Polyangia bacterium]